MTPTGTRLRVLRSVVALADHPYAVPDGEGVMPFQVRFFGTPECVTDVGLPTVIRHCRALHRDGYLRAVRPSTPRTYEPTDAGRDAAA